MGEAEIKDAELALSWQVTDALSLGITGGVTDTEVISLKGARHACRPLVRLDILPENLIDDF